MLYQLMQHGTDPTQHTSHTQSTTFSPDTHQGPRPLIRIIRGKGKSSQQKQITQDFFILTVKLDSILIYLCVCGKNLNFLSWAIRPVFADPVTLLECLYTIFIFNRNLQQLRIMISEGAQE